MSDDVKVGLVVCGIFFFIWIDVKFLKWVWVFYNIYVLWFGEFFGYMIVSCDFVVGFRVKFFVLSKCWLYVFIDFGL